MLARALVATAATTVVVILFSTSQAAALGLFFDVNLDIPASQSSRTVGLGTVFDIELTLFEDAGVPPTLVSAFAAQVGFNSSKIVLASTGVTWGAIAAGGAVDLNHPHGALTSPGTAALLKPTSGVVGFVDTTGGFAIGTPRGFFVSATPVLVATLTFSATGIGTTTIDLAPVDFSTPVLKDEVGGTLGFFGGAVTISVVPGPRGLVLAALTASLWIATRSYRLRAR